MGSRDWRVVGSVTAWQTAASLCYYTLFAGTALLREEFGISRTLVGLVLTAAMAGYTLTLFPSGAAIDGYGEKRPLLVSLLGLGAMAVAVSFAPSYLLLLVAAALLGAAYAPAIPGTNRAILTSVPLARRNLAMGIKQVGVTAGSGGAALLVNGLAAVYAWQTGFWVVAAVALLVTLLFVPLYTDDGGDGEAQWPDLRGLGGDPAYVRLVGAGFFVGAGIFTMTGYTVLYVDEAVGTGVAFAGVVLTVAQVTGSVGRLGGGALADRLGGGAQGAGTVMLGQVALAVLVFGALAVGVYSPLVTTALFALLGVSVLGTTGLYYSIMGDLVADEDIGAASAGGQTAVNSGGLLAPPLFGLLADSVGYRAGWALLGGCVVAATLLVLDVRRRT
ncbi:MFS transporter [Halomarina litorea]|uniref:MFS transporter n=1 Tax=Halomarina litorea TaxID=2961595 RepID=UPI0020C2F7FD|nr:MFS transporter [Halomarina sp. BCD28]